MDYYQRIQNAIDFIENHLQDECGIVEIAAAACFSPFHFQRLFQAITGFSVQAYIRQRRLTEAALLLKETDTSILEIALGAQFGSQEAFTRAFESLFGTTPAKYRKESPPLKLTGKMDFLSFQNRLTGELTMNKPMIHRMDKMLITGFPYHTTLADERYFSEIPRFYHDFGTNERYSHIPYKKAPAISYGISYDFQDDGRFSFLVGEEVETFVEPLRHGLINMQLPAGTYAVFTVNGSVELVQNTRRYIYGVWLPAANYERADGPDFEVTDVMRSIYPHAMRMKIYIPLA
ncbi:UNVERIFIED_CONTAM: AraC family transcriptional regulator [Brevibacillus sp. OAP136]